MQSVMLQRRQADRSEPLLVGVAEAARLLGISMRTLQSSRWVDVPRIVRGGRTLFSIAVLREWINNEISQSVCVASASNVKSEDHLTIVVTSFGCWEL